MGLRNQRVYMVGLIEQSSLDGCVLRNRVTRVTHSTSLQYVCITATNSQLRAQLLTITVDVLYPAVHTYVLDEAHEAMDKSIDECLARRWLQNSTDTPSSHPNGDASPWMSAAKA